jgi:asparagine synthase (glutamine-hydrolysing)
MCGIFGGWFLNLPTSFKANISSAIQALSFRGPNSNGYEVFDKTTSQIVLGHTRLSIIDLSHSGHQPMHSADGRFAIVFNGEIYNYRELRGELSQAGHNFYSKSDTEVLLTAWREWGPACLPRLIGMFAFVIYDKEAQTLTCARDAFGIKPFFYSSDPSQFLFASEQAALIALRNKQPEIDWQRSYDYLIHADYDSQERTFIADVKHLLPGHMMVFDLNKAKLNAPTVWWTPKTKERSELNFKQATESVREQFLQNVRLHLRSDVPLGAALSGGIDSSAVVCAMRYIEPNTPIHTFSYIAEGSSLSEEHWVDRVNQYTKAVAHKLVVTPQELAADLDDMILSQGEPFGSTSIYAQYRVFKLAKEANVTVTLDGQGADELLSGYNGYPGERLRSLLERGQLFHALKFAANWSRWPGRSYVRAWMHLGSLYLSEKLYAQAAKLVGEHAKPTWMNTHLLRDAGVRLQPTRILGTKEGRGRRVIEKLAISLHQKGLPELLRHGDRGSMRFSVESRVPFLTIPMADLLLSLPENYLISDRGETKHVFRAAMRGIVPDDVLDRREKIGFATPEKDLLLSMAPMLRGWLQAGKAIPFLNHIALLSQFDAIVANKLPFSALVWRWINYIRWHQHLIGETKL